MIAVIADDEPLARALLRTMLDELGDIAVAAEVSDGAAAVAAVRAHRPDLIFLDIDMPHTNGIHAALELATNPAEIIFLTAHEEHAIDAFEIGAIDYVLKPVRRPRLAKAMERARVRHRARMEPVTAANMSAAVESSDDAFWVPVLRGTVRVGISDIQRIEAAGDHVYFHTAERAYLYRTTMAELERRLVGSGLVRVHRSAFLRTDRVTSINRRGKVTAVTLSDGTEIPVGRNYRTTALQALGAA